MDGGTFEGRVVDPGGVAPQCDWAGSLGAVRVPGGGGVVSMVAAFRGWLASVDAAALSDRERVDLVASLEGAKGAISAVQARATDALRCSRVVVGPRDVGRSVGSVVALARRESPSLGDRFVGLSRALVHEMPATMVALSAGLCSERVVVAVVAATATLSREDRGVVDARVGPLLGRLGVRQAGAAAARVAAELDAASVVARMEAAVRSRRVTVRPAPDGMAYLSVLGPLTDVVGAFAAVQARSRAVVSGQCPDEGPAGRGVGAVAADTALRLLSGRAVGQLQPVEVHLVMTDRALLGVGDPDRSVMEPARVPGHGSVPAPVARAWLRDGLDAPPSTREGPPAAGAASPATGDGSPARADRSPGGGAVPAAPGDASGMVGSAARVWVRRLYTSPDGRDLVAMDSRRRLFGGLLRRMLVLRDDVCTTPWCQAPIVHADHTLSAREGGATTFEGGNGKCARCNQTKEAPGWRTRVVTIAAADADADVDGDRRRPRAEGRLAGRVVRVTTPLGHRYDSEPPPLLGWGSQTQCSQTQGSEGRAAVELRPAPETPQRRKRPLRRARTTYRAPAARRPRITSHLERRLCRYLT